MEIQKQIDQLLANKQKEYELIKKTRDKILVYTYAKLLDGETISQIHRKISNIISFKQDPIMFRNATVFLNKIGKQIKKDKDLKKDSNYFYLLLMANDFGRKTLMKDEYKSLNKFEGEGKQQILKDYKSENREEKVIFYVASHHPDCAEDHLPCQRKIFVDEKWRSYVSPELKNQVASFISNHNIRTVEWVINEPYYFLTRPNCRHVLNAVKTEDILGKSISAIQRKYSLRSNTKSPYSQTLRRQRDQEDNINTIIKQYNERKDLIVQLNKVSKTAESQADLHKVNLLIKKWEKELQNSKK